MHVHACQANEARGFSISLARFDICENLVKEMKEHSRVMEAYYTKIDEMHVQDTEAPLLQQRLQWAAAVDTLAAPAAVAFAVAIAALVAAAAAPAALAVVAFTAAVASAVAELLLPPLCPCRSSTTAPALAAAPGAAAAAGAAPASGGSGGSGGSKQNVCGSSDSSASSSRIPTWLIVFG